MFIASTKFLLPKSAANVDLKNMLNISFVQSLDLALKHDRLDPNGIMPIVAGSGQVNNFRTLCDPNGEWIKRPALEIDLKVLQRPGQPWCSDPSRSVCIQSCYVFEGAYFGGVTGYNAVSSAEEQKDLGMASESELRYFTSEAEMGMKLPIASLTGIDTPTRGILEQNMFYFNQLMQYGKVVVFVQEHPTDANQSVVSAFVVFGVQTTAFNKQKLKWSVKDILLGKSIFNGGKGITRGLNYYTADLAQKLAEIMSK